MWTFFYIPTVAGLLAQALAYTLPLHQSMEGSPPTPEAERCVFAETPRSPAGIQHPPRVSSRLCAARPGSSRFGSTSQVGCAPRTWSGAVATATRRWRGCVSGPAGGAASHSTRLPTGFAAAQFAGRYISRTCSAVAGASAETVERLFEQRQARHREKTSRARSESWCKLRCEGIECGIWCTLGCEGKLQAAQGKKLVQSEHQLQWRGQSKNCFKR